MLHWLVALLAGLFAAALQYGRGVLYPRTVPLALLRGVVATLVVALLLGAPARPGRALTPDVAVDASESWLRGTSHCDRWRMALDSASVLGRGHWMRFGDSSRADPSADAPADHASRLRPVADRAAGTGRPMVVITDGELDDPEVVGTLPRGSRTIVIPCLPAPDVAVALLDAPRTLLAGDTATAQLTLIGGPRGGPPGTLELRLDASVLASTPFEALGPYAERAIALRGVAAGAERGGVLRGVIHGAGDGDFEPRNDTLAMGVDVSRAPAAVFVSTAPDYDAREAVAALRSVTSLPTRAYYRVAAGAWRTDGTLARVDESTVKAAVADAPLVVLHGDTSVFGPPRSATRGALLLFAPPLADDGEWFAAATPASPLAPALSALPFDSLPPVSVTASMPRGEWQGLIARRGGAPDDRRVALVGWDTPRHVAVLGAAGLWRWRFRGGTRADAYGVLFGSLYDWLAAGRSDRRSVVPDAEPLRAGMPVRWRRGASGDSVVHVTITRRSATGRVYSLALRFTEGANVVESPPLPPGVYDAKMPGGSAVIVVNASRELIPRRPTVSTGTIGGLPLKGAPSSVREIPWVWLLAIALLCTEWVLRRRMGLR
jgi:hypothetical protein